MIDIASTQHALDGLGDAPPYSTARALLPLVINLLGEEASANSMVSWLNLGYAGQGGTLQRYNDQCSAFTTEITDTSSHSPDDPYQNWPAFKNFFMAVVEEANAIEEGTGHTFDDISASITQDIPEAIENAPEVVGNALGSVATAAGNAVGNAAGGILSGLSLPLMAIVAVAVFVFVKSR